MRIGMRNGCMAPASQMVNCIAVILSFVLILLCQSVDGYQLKRRGSFLSRLKTTTKQRTIPTSTNNGKSKRNYRNDVMHEEDANVSVKIDRCEATNKKQGRRIQSPLIVRRKPKASVRTVDELRHAILDQKLSLNEVSIAYDDDDELIEEPASVATDFFHNHAVRELIKDRYEMESMPGHRLSNDTSILALSIEGGGMRGCVSAGMVAAIASLGLSDTIDRVYGSSAGSVVGAYLVSRQVCMDVYVDILPAAQKLFVCKQRMIKGLASSLVDVLMSSLRKENAVRNDTNATTTSARLNPGMNISFVLDGIMGQDHGIRPLDIETFRQNDAKQPLRVVSSTIDPETGRLYSKCFGTEDFFDGSTVEKADGTRRGLFACLEASMTVPGATGPPVMIRQPDSNHVLPCFDAFCFEPIPYRSAVEEGATHVLVLSSRPEEYQPKTRQGVYETGVAPLYFHSHGYDQVAEFFERGGQQYLYAEDLLTLEHAKTRKLDPSSTSEENERVMVPPPEILYGVPDSPEKRKFIENRESQWRRAHLMPLRVPRGHKELPTLEQGKQAVLEAVRGGFATAFDSLSSIVGLEHIPGAEAAKLVFPEDDDEFNVAEILGSVMKVPGEEILGPASVEAFSDNSANEIAGGDYMQDPFDLTKDINDKSRDRTILTGQNMKEENLSHHALLAILPGFRGGRFGHLARGLRSGASTSIGEN
ncbi:patatin-like phospholipase [Nitzschia inconspicua]|uniref:Patatin-like phospholipase n=1 Tax=Nitzschia inconspicua TaxID=303405 RepID=A0A9K3KKS6_9STRA|nr:patatin-like phospholipase [Nitzschia inconspicua]